MKYVLKKCPRCNSDLISITYSAKFEMIDARSKFGERGVAVYCECCGLDTRTYSNSPFGVESAIGEWNKLRVGRYHE